MINGAISTSEGTRLVFVLKEIRCTREALAAADAVALAEAKAAAATAQAAPTTLAINITSVPSGHYLQADGSFAPMPDNMLQLAPPELNRLAAPEALPVEETTSQSAEEAEARIIQNLKDEINQLSRKMGLSVVV